MNNVQALARRFPALFAATATLILLVISTLIRPDTNWAAQLTAFVPLVMIAVANVPAIVSGGGGIDLSVGPVATLSSILLAGYLAPAGLNTVLVVPVLVAVGASIGLINGLIIVGLRLPPVVVTLATMFIVTGVNLRLAPRPIAANDSWTVLISTPGVGPLIAIAFIAVAVGAWFLCLRTPFGRNVYAVGGNDVAAYSAGIPVSRVRVLAYTLGGGLAGLAGPVLLGVSTTADAAASQAYILIALAAVALGGTSLRGGRGGVTGALLGASAIFMLQGIIAGARIPSVWLPVLYGAILIVSLLMGSILTRRKQQS